MKYLLILILILLPFLYLNRSYAYFFDFQGSHFIGNPSYPSPYTFNEGAVEERKLAVLGDSLMAGTGSTSFENSMAYIIGSSLAGEKRLTMINLASPGVGVEDVLLRQVPQAVNEKPDHIVLLIGTNDVNDKKQEALFRDYYTGILEKLTTQTGAKITVVNIPYIGSDKILYPPWDSIIDLQIRKFNNIISQAATEKNLTVIDLYSQFKGAFRRSSTLYSRDEFHPSDEGYKLWGDYINAGINR